ncbi:MAG TPA: phosphoglycerate kinase [Candidatus Binatia bacterium]|nr:phosphoglycerate kinase [Candidatus Binatia bacterium]
MALQSIESLDFEGKRVFVRVDFNVPLTEQGEVGDDTRIREALPTLQYILKQGAKLVLASHLGRPKGKADPALSLKPVVERLSTLLGRQVAFADDCVGPRAEEKVAHLKNGEALLLENLRFHAGEEKNDAAFARALAGLGDIYVNDAFGSSHRAHASVVGMVSHFDQKRAGFLMQKEVEALSRLRDDAEKPFVLILGGAKVSDKIGVIRSLLPRIDVMIIGGAMAYTLLKAQGIPVGKSRIEEDQLGEAKKIFEQARRQSVKILLPEDHTVVEKLEPPTPASATLGQEIPEDKLGVDIGPKTIKSFGEALQEAHTIFWNGPMGVFESPPFDQGTRAVAQAMPSSHGFKVVGGGDTVAALTQANLLERFDHVSTGGGASLEFLENGDLPGLAALRNAG